jgi:hypothetical protein
MASAAGIHAFMRFTYATAAIGIAASFTAPLMGASAHADSSGYSNCLANLRDNPVTQPDPRNMYTARLIEMDLQSGIPPAAEARKVAQMGFDTRTAEGIVRCVMQNNP